MKPTLADRNFEPSDEELLALGGEPGDKIVPCVPDLHPLLIAATRELMQDSDPTLQAVTDEVTAPQSDSPDSRPQGSRPQRGRIERYPLLCLDIDGVCAPIGQNPRFHCHGPPPGFVDCGMSVQMHPAVPGWLAEMEAAFASVCWISSWEANCNLFAEELGLRSALEWTHIDGWSARDEAKTGIGRKLRGLARVVDPAAPVAVVDDHLGPQYLCDSRSIPRPGGRGEEHWGIGGATIWRRLTTSAAALDQRCWSLRPARWA